MKCSIIRALFVLALTSLSCGSLSAATVIQHTGLNDPLTESPAWELFIGAQAGTTSSAGGTDSGTDYWSIVTSGRTRRYEKSDASIPAAIADPNGWRLSAEMRLVTSSSAAFQTFFFVNDGVDQWGLSFADGTGSDPAGIYYINSAVSPVQITTVSLNPTDGYHEYEMIYDPAGDGGMGSTDVWVDGFLAATLTRSQVRNITTTFIGFGNGAAAGSSNSRWANVLFETIELDAVSNAVPEPTSASLLALGLFMLRRRRARSEG